jgi:hypothetical protein
MRGSAEGRRTGGGSGRNRGMAMVTVQRMGGTEIDEENDRVDGIVTAELGEGW